MKLHNRQIKGEFWTDAELQFELDGMGRLTYLGLIQIADDSGCIEDDVRAIKLLLFPVDEQMPTSKITEYRDRLTEMGKLIPYQVDDKSYIFLKNFHKHQALRSPCSPSMPLPPWIKWIQASTNYRSGHYEVSDITSCHTTEAVQEPYSDRNETVENRTAAVRFSYGDCTETVHSSTSSSISNLNSSSSTNEDKSVEIEEEKSAENKAPDCSWCKKPKTEAAGVQFLFQQMHNQYRERFGTCPHIIPGKDGSLLRGLMKGRTEAVILQIYGKYLNISDPFYEKHGYSIALFAQQFDGIRMRGDTDGERKDKLTDLSDPRI